MATIRKRGTKHRARYHVQVRRKGTRPITRSFATLHDAKTWARNAEVVLDRQNPADAAPRIPSPPHQHTQESARDHAQDQAQDHAQELAHNHITAQHITLGQLVTRYINSVTIRKRSAAAETLVLRAFCRHRICTTPISDLTTSHFASYRDERLNKLKPSSVRRELTPIRHLFEIARKEWGLPLPPNPLANLAFHGADQRRERRLKPEEYDALISATKRCRNKLIAPLIVFALSTAMRRGEILAMRWTDIDEARRSLLIPTSKTGRARTIPLSPPAIGVLQTLPRTAERVFPLSANAGRLAWEKLCKRAKIKDLHFHDLRHEAISRFFEMGLTAPEVALMSGHQDARMLFRYAHPLRQRIASRLDQQPALLTHFGDPQM